MSYINLAVAIKMLLDDKTTPGLPIITPTQKREFEIFDSACDRHAKMLSNIPAADVRSVILCKDCIHYEMGACLKIYDDGNVSADAWQERRPDDFCSYAEDRNNPPEMTQDLWED